MVEEDEGTGSTGGRSNDWKRRVEEAENEKLRAQQEAQHYRNVAAAQGHIDRAMATLDSEGRAAEAEYSSAMEAGDFTAGAAATRRMAAVEKRRLQLQDHAEAVQRAPVPAGDPFESHVNRFTPRTAEWMRSHRDWVTDPRKSSKLQGAHHMAIGDGLTPDTDEYFAHVEKTIGMRSGGNVSSRSGNMRSEAGDGGGAVSVTLTRGERERATDGSLVWNHGPNKGKPLGVQEYARRKLEMEKQGYYSKLG